jgi:hypothetical protein
MTMTDQSVFLSKNFLEFVVSGNYLLQESIRTLAEELKEKIGIKLPQELKLFQDTEIELKQKLGLKLFQDVEQEVEDEFPNRKEYSWSGGDLQRGVNFNKTADTKTLQICKAASLVYLGDLRLKKNLFLKEQVLAPISVRNAVEARVNEVTEQITEKLGDVELDEVWKEVIRYHFRDHFQAVKDVLATLDRPTNATPFFAPPPTSQVPTQMSALPPSEGGYQLYQSPTASQSVPPRRPQVLQATPLPPIVKEPEANSFSEMLVANAPILVGLACFVGTVGFFVLNSFSQNTPTVVSTAPQPAEFVSPTNNSTAIESSTLPAVAPQQASVSVPTSTAKPAITEASVTPAKQPLIQTPRPKVSSNVVPASVPAAEPSPSRRSQRRFHSRRHKSRHGSRHHARG